MENPYNVPDEQSLSSEPPVKNWQKLIGGGLTMIMISLVAGAMLTLDFRTRNEVLASSLTLFGFISGLLLIVSGIGEYLVTKSIRGKPLPSPTSRRGRIGKEQT